MWIGSAVVRDIIQFMTSNIIKRVIILAVVLLGSYLFWFSLSPWLLNPLEFSNYDLWVTPLIILIILAPVIVLALMFFTDRLLKILVAVTVVVPFLLVFGLDLTYLSAIGILFLLFWYGDRHIREELEQRIKINPGLIMARGLKKIFMSLMVMISFAYYLTPGVQATAISDKLPPSIRQIVDVSVGTFLAGQLEQFPESERNKVHYQVVEQVMSQFNNALRPYFQYIPPFLAFGLFLILQGLSFIFVFFSVLVGIFLYRVLKQTGFVKIEERDVKAERLVEI